VQHLKNRRVVRSCPFLHSTGAVSYGRALPFYQRASLSTSPLKVLGGAARDCSGTATVKTVEVGGTRHPVPSAPQVLPSGAVRKCFVHNVGLMK
jgi:hypothetical protein